MELSEPKRHGQMIVHTDDPYYTFAYEDDCATPSNGPLYTAEKHGYSDPVRIPWPPH